MRIAPTAEERRPPGSCCLTEGTGAGVQDSAGEQEAEDHGKHREQDTQGAPDQPHFPVLRVHSDGDHFLQPTDLRDDCVQLAITPRRPASAKASSFRSRSANWCRMSAKIGCTCTAMLSETMDSACSSAV